MAGQEHSGSYLRNQIYPNKGFGNITNNINLHYRPNSEKINNQNFSTNSKKLFWANFHHFSSKKTFSTKTGSVHTSSYGFLTTTKIKKKTTIQFQENVWIDGQMDEKMDRPYFIGPIQLLLRVQKCLFA